MHHPKTRPVFEPLFVETTRQIDLFTPKHILWSCFIKYDRYLCFGLNAFSYSAISVTNKTWFKNWSSFRVVHLLVYSSTYSRGFIFPIILPRWVESLDIKSPYICQMSRGPTKETHSIKQEAINIKSRDIL